jgi:hypothetical protein
MTQRIHIAVAGAGVIGQAHIKRILEEPQAELAAIIDPSPKANEQAQALGVPAFADLEEGLQASKPNGVVIATPNQLHVPNGLTAVAAGVPMLLEKPVSGDVESAMQLVEAAERAAVAILVGHHRRHSPLIQRAREIVESGRLGKLTAVTGLSLFLKPKDYFDGSGAWRREPGGGVVLINLIHVIDDLRNMRRHRRHSGSAVEHSPRLSGRGYHRHDPALRQRRARHPGDLGRRERTVELGADLGREQGLPANRPVLLPRGRNRRLADRSAPGCLEPRGRRMVDADGGRAAHRARAGPAHRADAPLLPGHPWWAKPILDGRGGTRTLETTLAVKKVAETGAVVCLS